MTSIGLTRYDLETCYTDLRTVKTRSFGLKKPSSNSITSPKHSTVMLKYYSANFESFIYGETDST